TTSRANAPAATSSHSSPRSSSAASWHRSRRLTWNDARTAMRLMALTGHAWLGLIAFDVARLGGFARLHDWIRRCRPNVRRRASSPTAEEVVWSIDEACVWYVKRVACLQRSAIATWLLRRH